MGNQGKVAIISLNSHFCSGENGTICWYGVKEARVWIKVCNSQSRYVSLEGVNKIKKLDSCSK